MKVFLNQIMNLRSTTTGNNYSETTTDDSLSSMQHDYNQYEIVFSSNTLNNNTRFGSSNGVMNDYHHDEDDDLSALTMPSCIFNNNWYYYPFTSMEGTIPPLLTIETEQVNTQTENYIPNEIGFAPLAMSHNDANINDDSDYRTIRRSFAFDEDDDDDDGDRILTSPSDGDDSSNESNEDGNSNQFNDKMDDNNTNFRVIVPSSVEQGHLCNTHMPYNVIDDKACITKSDMLPHLPNSLKWKANLSIRTRRLGRRRKRSYKVSI